VTATPATSETTASVRITVPAGAKSGLYPDTLTVTAPAATALTGVGFASHPDGVPTDFTVQTRDGAHWADQVHLTGNTAVYRWTPFPAPVTTTQVRIAVTAAQNGFSRIAELTP
jgi:alpha-L-rhamnosidase